MKELLPEKIYQNNLSDIEYIELLIDYYNKNILNKITFNNTNISIKKYPIIKIFINEVSVDLFSNFWHLISDSRYNNSEEQERVLNKNRCEHISYIDFIFENINDLNNSYIWKNERKTKHKGISKRICICYDWKYLIVLNIRNEEIIFWTAYPLEYSHTIKKCKKEYQEYIKNNSI